MLTETGVPPARLPPPVRPGVVRTYSGEARRGSDVGDVAVLASTCPLGSIYRTLTAYPLCAWCYGCRRRLCRWGRYLRVECRGGKSVPLRAQVPTPENKPAGRDHCNCDEPWPTPYAAGRESSSYGKLGPNQSRRPGPRRVASTASNTDLSTSPKPWPRQNRDVGISLIQTSTTAPAPPASLLHRNFASNKQSGMTGTRISRSPTSRLPSDQRRLRKPRKGCRRC